MFERSVPHEPTPKGSQLTNGSRIVRPSRVLLEQRGPLPLEVDSAADRREISTIAKEVLPDLLVEAVDRSMLPMFVSFIVLVIIFALFFC